MKKYLKHIAVLTLAGFAVLVACEKDELVEGTNTEQEIAQNKGETDQQRKKFTSPYLGDCDYCFQRTKVCISPTNTESWSCYEKEGGYFFRTLNLSYRCGSLYKTVNLITITNSTPLETQCFYVDVPVNTPVTLTSNGGCAHDYLCDIDVTFTTAPWEGSSWGSCVTEASYDSNGGEPLWITDREWFEVCSHQHCYVTPKDEVRLE